MRWDRRELFHPDVIATTGNNETASPLLLSPGKVSSIEELLNGQTCQEMLFVSTWSPHKWCRRSIVTLPFCSLCSSLSDVL